MDQPDAGAATPGTAADMRFRLTFHLLDGTSLIIPLVSGAGRIASTAAPLQTDSLRSRGRGCVFSTFLPLSTNVTLGSDQKPAADAERPPAVTPRPLTPACPCLCLCSRLARFLSVTDHKEEEEEEEGWDVKLAP